VTGKVVNLRQARKAHARSVARMAADANAARHGRTKAQREAEEKAAERARRALDGHEVERGEE
jgi:hypothetical protein